MEKLDILKKNIKWIVFTLLTITVAFIAWGVIKFKVLPMDEWALNLVINYLLSERATKLVALFLYILLWCIVN